MIGSIANNNNNMAGGYNHSYNLFGNIQMLSIMNSVRTGDPTMDTLLAMMLPVILSIVLTWLNKQKDCILIFLKKRAANYYTKTYRRTIAFSSSTKHAAVRSHNGGAAAAANDDESYNHFLVKAIQLYIHSCCHLDLDDADLKLTTVDTTQVMDDEDQCVMQNNSRGGSSRGGSNKATSTGQLLKYCQLIKQPPQRRWHKVGTFDGAPVMLRYETARRADNGGFGGGGFGFGVGGDGGGGGDSIVETQFVEVVLESTGKTSIDAFVEIAYNWYKDELQKLQNDNRYLYDFSSLTINPRDTRLTPVYTRYMLGEEKTFENLFCRAKTESLIKMVDDFETKKGKYGVPGFPHKLGILLSGPPGTGKTSLIKALAHYTRRQIVTVPLSRITTNQGLMAILFNKVCTVAGLQKAVKLGQEDVIFVLEDVDAASDVVKRRELVEKKKMRAKKKQQQQQLEMERQAAAAVGGMVPSNGMAWAYGGRAAAMGMGDPKDQLSLAGLLNALDGIVDTPGRIVIMTTNHPEILDPALVRPGRIDKNIKLGYMDLEDAVAMTEHYFKTKLSDAQNDKFQEIFGTSPTAAAEECLQITPAEVELFIMAEDEVDGLIKRLDERRAQSKKAAQEAEAKELGQAKEEAATEESLACDTKAIAEESLDADNTVPMVNYGSVAPPEILTEVYYGDEYFGDEYYGDY